MSKAEIAAAMKNARLADWIYGDLPKQLKAPDESSQTLAVHILRYRLQFVLVYNGWLLSQLHNPRLTQYGHHRSVLVLEMGSEKLGEIASSLLLLLEGKDGVSAAIIGLIAEYAASYARPLSRTPPS
jgi:hypothetical protein